MRQSHFDLTTIHVIKSLAVLVMLVDHVGAFFYPEVGLYRAIGRVGFPVWFFYAGVTALRASGSHLISAASLLQFGLLTLTPSLLPLNALFSIWVSQSIARKVSSFELSLLKLTLLTALFGFLLFPTLFLWQYGSVAIVFSISGIFYAKGDRKLSKILLALGVALFLPWQIWLSVSMTGLQKLACSLGTIIVVVGVYRIERRTLHAPAALSKPVKWVSQNTLGIYFVHYLAFSYLASLV